MNSRVVVTLEAVILAAAAAFLVYQVAGIWPSVSTAVMARGLDKARAAGDPARTEKAVKALLRQRPGDGSLHLLFAGTILARGEFDRARDAYAEAAKKSLAPEHRAAAELGLGVALLLKATPPSPESLEAARQAFEKASGTTGVAGDAKALLAVAHIWAGDLDAARAAAEAAKGALGLEPSAALACVRAYLAAAAGDPPAALEQTRRARMLVPGENSPLGKYVSSAMKSFEVEAAAWPGADSALRARMLRHLQEEGPKGITDERTYPLFFRAAASCAASVNDLERKVGMDLLSRAAESRPTDPMPLVATAAALATRSASAWKQAEDAAKGGPARGAGADERGPQLLDLLPGGDKSGAKPKTTTVSRPLQDIDAAGARVGEALAKAAALYVASGGEDDPARAFEAFDYMFRWHLRASELSPDAASRRESRLAAAGQAVAMDKLLGAAVPRTDAAALLLRNAGAIFAGELAWAEANACFARSLELRPDQPGLKPYAESVREPPRVVAVHPSRSGELQAGLPLVGVELALPEAIGSLRDCKVEASVGTGDADRKAVNPVVSGTGLWYLPKEAELPEGLVDVRFAISGPSAHNVEAKVAFRIDGSAPEITSRFPEPDAVVSDRTTVIRFGWRDPSGIVPDSVEVVLEPVATQTRRKVLVANGLQMSARFTGDYKWNRKAPVVPDEGATEGTIVTGTMGDLSDGVFRVRVRMRDAVNHLREDAWKFTVR